MRPALLLAALVSGAAAHAGEPSLAPRAPEAREAEAEAPRLFGLAEAATDPQVRARAEFLLASSLQRTGLPFAAVIAFTPLVRAGPTHPFHLQAVEAVVELQEVLGDDALVPSLLNNTYDRFSEAWRRLPAETLARINYLIGRVAHRKGLLEEARQFLAAVPRSSRSHARAQVLLGITLADPRYPAVDAAAREALGAEAEDAFRVAMAADPELASPVRQLALLGLARVNYNLGRYAEAVRRYDELPASSPFHDQALFEGGFARFQDDDPGGALGSLEGLAAPQFERAFQPEAPILAATIYYFSCLHEQALAALGRFDARYPPMAAQLQTLLEGPPPTLPRLLELLDAPGPGSIPAPVAAWVRSAPRVRGVLALLEEAAREAALARARPAWVAARLSDEVVASLEQNRGTLEQLATSAVRTRLTEAARSLRGFADQAEILRFEVAKAEKELAEAGIDTRAVLEAQTLRPPAVPSDQWDAWRFQGEFWRDELGSYRFTLKRGCAGAR